MKVVGQDRVIIHDIKLLPESGEITFKLTGKSATPKDKPDGDTSIQAIINGQICDEAKVIVIIPAAVGPNHQGKSGAVPAVNLAAGKNTSPTDFFPSLGQFQCLLITYYAQWITVPVIDQFGQPLDTMYQDFGVSEFVHGGAWIKINQYMAADGTYQDPVFSYTPKAPGKNVYLCSSNEAKAWPSDPLKMPIDPINDRIQNIGVIVAGHVLNPHITNRHLTAKAPDEVDVVWP